MKLSILLCACLTLALIQFGSASDCKRSTDEATKGVEECDGTEYQTYVECMRRRMKRDTGCNKSESCTDCQESECHQCDCDFCAVNVCDSSCDSCCVDNPPCKNKRCCHKTCHSRCKTVSCRTDCRRNCVEKVVAPQPAVEGNSSVVVETPRHNVTTIIEIRNVINNTNEIQIPVQVNNTNYNNFTLPNPTSSQVHPGGNGEENPEQCCQIISPRQCTPQKEYPFVKCFHFRKKACGSFCQAPTLFEQTREICEQTKNGTSCRQQLVYVPQVQQPGCNFQPTWPYVHCGMPQLPYGYGPPPIQQPPNFCIGCYNDPYSWGSYYQQPPIYGPGYSPVVPGFQGPYNYGYNYYPAYPNPNNAVPPTITPKPANDEAPTNESSSINNIAGNTQYYYPQVPQYPYQYQYQPPHPPVQWQSYYPVQTTPLGYPYPLQVPVYYLPPEVDIQATVSHPEKNTRYAQITIDDKKENPNAATESNLEKVASE